MFPSPFPRGSNGTATAIRCIRNSEIEESISVKVPSCKPIGRTNRPENLFRLKRSVAFA